MFFGGGGGGHPGGPYGGCCGPYGYWPGVGLLRWIRHRTSCFLPRT
ncbi:hypothetical protein [Kibdelosporangium philippinense]